MKQASLGISTRPCPKTPYSWFLMMLRLPNTGIPINDQQKEIDLCTFKTKVGRTWKRRF